MVEYIQLFLLFFKVGIFSFGGGYVMLPMIYQEINILGLMPASEFSNVVALSQMTPGPIAVNAATYVGFKSAGFWGATFATLGVTLPSFFIILLISAFFYKFKKSPIVQAILTGIRPATVGLIISAVIFFAESSIFTSTLKSGKFLENPIGFFSIPALLIFTVTILLNKKFKVGPIPLTILAGVAGAFIL